MLAHLIGDGSFVRRQPIRYASIDEAQPRGRHRGGAGTSASPRCATTTPRARARRCACRRPFRLTHGVRNPIAAWLDGLGLFGARSHEKFVPAPVAGLPKEQISLFLRHLWATDGSVTVRKDGRGGRIYYASTSRRLVDDVSRLLLRFGIQTAARGSPARPATATATRSTSRGSTTSVASSTRSACTASAASPPPACSRSCEPRRRTPTSTPCPRGVGRRRASR